MATNLPCLLHNNRRNFATNASIPVILDANNGLSQPSDTMVASVAPPESQKKSLSSRKKKRYSFVCLANEVTHFSEVSKCKKNHIFPQGRAGGPLGPRAARESTQKHCWGVCWQCWMIIIAKISRGG